MEAKFQFYEIVRVSDSDGNFTEVSGSEGAILGMAEEDGKWVYSVSLFDTGETWNFPETALVSTGKHSRREDYYDGSSAKVVVDKDTGEGKEILGRNTINANKKKPGSEHNKR